MHVVFLIYPNVTQLDFTGPAQVLSRLPNARVDYAWKTREPVLTDSGFSVLPTATLAEVTHADILCVPGGIGCTDVMEDEEIVAWLAETGAASTWVTSVCTGSLILAAAGLLTGYRATCHWAWHDYLALFGAEPVRQRVVFDRSRVTGGGVTAGIDFGFALMATIAGEEHARMVQLGLEYDPAPPFDSGAPDKATPETVARLSTLFAGQGNDRDARIRAVAERSKETA
ncbi:DJ-1/PfpI family protein [Sphingomonas cavernae]|nr:DJ-1/PfpI family protein [Sphingomonas cavernae]